VFCHLVVGVTWTAMSVRFTSTGMFLSQVPKGVQNLGNTCYFSSVCQLLAAAPAFRRACTDKVHQQNCAKNARRSTCLGCNIEGLVNRIRNRSKGSSSSAPPMHQHADDTTLHVSTADDLITVFFFSGGGPTLLQGQWCPS
jgi:uncharacterized UBP type Zn finger protein